MCDVTGQESSARKACTQLKKPIGVDVMPIHITYMSKGTC